MTTDLLAVPLAGINNAMILGNTSPAARTRMLDDLLAKHRDQVLAEHAEQRAMSSLTGAAALRSASLQAYEGIATHGMPHEVQQQVSAWLSRLASEVEGRARTAIARTGQEG